jgi:branched-chain amino acid transport system substrate-binding protein
VMIPPDFTNFWKQSYQQGFKPRMASIGKALLFPSALEALGTIGYGLTTEVWWSPNHPFKSWLSGQTCQQFADAFTASTGKQWTQPLLHYAVFEVVANALSRCKNVEDKQSILDAVKATNLDTICGNVNWQAGPPQDPVPNVSKTPLVGGQWVKGTKWPYDLKVVTNVTAKMVPVQQKVAGIKY